MVSQPAIGALACTRDTLEARFGRRVDFVWREPSETSRSPIRRRILAEARPLYAA
jgi:hypothetical protein